MKSFDLRFPASRCALHVYPRFGTRRCVHLLCQIKGMPNLTCVWQWLLWHNVLNFISTETTVQRFVSSVFVFSFLLFSSLWFLVQHVFDFGCYFATWHVWPHDEIRSVPAILDSSEFFEKLIFFLTRPKTHPLGGRGQNQKFVMFCMPSFSGMVMERFDQRR